VTADDALSLPGAPAQLGAPQNVDHLANARAVAAQNPVAVANIVRGWVKGDA
jgi:flagellar M-ring protein FliF